MQSLPEPAIKLINDFSQLPGIGKKTAQRLVFFLLSSDYNYTNNLSESLKNLKSKIKNCSICHGITELEPCLICTSSKRQDNLLCIVENAFDVFVFEKINSFRGRYHVLGGVISPLDGIGPDNLNIKSLLERVDNNMEIIIATNSSVEGETTSLYLSKILTDKVDRVSKLARGVPVGAELEYIDEATLTRAMEGRTSI